MCTCRCVVNVLPLYVHMYPGALQIDQSEETDQGKYECVATNSEGTRYSTPANLYVRGTALSYLFESCRITFFNL